MRHRPAKYKSRNTTMTDSVGQHMNVRLHHTSDNTS